MNKNEAKLKHHALHDELTNLPNRFQFTRRLKRANEQAKKDKEYMFAILFMDLDRFKLINDSLGHQIGDHLLIAVAQRLENCIRPNDIVARFGGDEFAIFLDNISDVSDAIRMSKRIKTVLSLPFNISGNEIYTSGSIGIASSATGYDNVEDILRDADSAMYRAKSHGKARYEIFDTEMHNNAIKLLKLEADLRQAIEHNEFLVHYQPIVSLTSGRIIRAEALIRWEHPQRGIISPLEFIPIAEETGLITAIGEWVLREACARNKAWHDEGYDHLVMDVNFSVRQFQQQDLLELIKRILTDTGLSAEFLNIEITESIAMEDLSIDVLNDLTAMGVQTSIDDFGTGYSSLGSIKNFPISVMKIDKSFVQDIADSSDAKAIIKAIIAMAKSLKIKVVAEGVETEEQLSFLRSHHCDEIQGYFYSRPVPDEEFTKLLKKGCLDPLASIQAE